MSCTACGCLLLVEGTADPLCTQHGTDSRSSLRSTFSPQHVAVHNQGDMTSRRVATSGAPSPRQEQDTCMVHTNSTRSSSTRSSSDHDLTVVDPMQPHAIHVGFRGE